MKKRKRIMLKGLAVFAGIIVVLSSFAPLFETNGNAIVLSALVGAFGAGAAFAGLMKDVREKSEHLSE